MGRAVAAGIVLGTTVGVAACFFKPDRPEGIGVSDGSITDDGTTKLDGTTTGSDAAQPACVFYGFDVPSSSCGAFATTFAQGGGSAMIDGGTLRLSTATGSGSSSIACIMNPQPITTATLEILQVVSTSIESTKFVLADSGAEYGILFDNGSYSIDCGGAITFGGTRNPADAGFVQLQYSRPNLRFAFATSASGPWMEAGTMCQLTDTDPALTIGVGRSGGSGVMMTAVFSSLEVCR